MKPAQRKKLQAACDAVGKMMQDGAEPTDIIIELMQEHDAVYNNRREPYSLRCVGVVSSCTWSRDYGVLSNWQRNATIRLMAANAEATS